MRAKNACKTCALGMGGQAGGMVNEAGHFPEVCKKSLQAMVADMQGAIRPEFFETYSLPQLQAFSPRELEIVRPPHARRSLVSTTVRNTTGRSPGTRPSIASRAKLKHDRARRNASGTSAAAARTKPAFCCNCSPGSTAPTTSTIAATTATRPAASGLTSALGSGTATVTLDDVEQADLVFVIGGNPASNHPRLMRTLMHVRRSRRRR